ncbi:hypothetical protein [Hansschlegelia plantiphila]|uniref:Uncharacterized protein n=1 Tax=Hansschlegelia plantiphila TaxID=374655 RepID=A0A9W6MUL4_9HYPH|nr:hypothetical protein [Hansschlegelia plantiphila]GLK67018.1 hypothetical protein GCM10008179_06560 [Hansschlegelia plantiphila]
MEDAERRPVSRPIAVDRQTFRELVGIGGAALAGYGAWLHYPPLGFMVGGFILVGLAILGTMRGEP